MASPNLLYRIGVPVGAKGTRATFGAGHFAKSLVWSLTDLLFSYQANAVMGLSAAATGLLLTVTMLYSGALDIGIAWMLRAAEGRPERTLHLQLVGGIATAFLVILLFYPFAAGPSVTLMYLAVVSILFRTAYAMYDVAQNALTSLLPTTSADASAYVTVRMIMGAAARLCIAVSAALFVGDIAGAVSHAAFVTVPIAIMVLISAIKLSRVCLPERLSPTCEIRGRIAAGMMCPLIAAIAHVGGLALLSRFLLFVDGNAADNGTGTILLLSFVAGTVVGPSAAARLKASIDGERISAIFVGATIVGASCLALAPHASSALPAALLYGIGLGGSGALIWTAVSNAIRTHAARTGVHTDLLSFAALTATIKISAAASALMLGFLLDGFKAGDSASVATIIGITLIGGGVFVAAIHRSRPTEYFYERKINCAHIGVGR